MDPNIAAQLHKIVVAQWIMALSMLIVALGILGVAVGAFLAARKAANAASDSLSKITGTVEDLNKRLRAGVDAVEDRVKRFGAVVDVVQAEAEELLLDAASTAHGVHTTAQMLRGSGEQAVRRSGEE